MIFGLITFLSALTISAVAIYYSVAGLAAIFAAATIPIIIMGVSLEIGKLVTAVWLHRYWDKAVWWMRTYLSIAVLVLMFITSMGIFGFLSKAHIEQTSLSQEQVALIDTLNDKETRAQAKIDRWRVELDRLVKGEDVRVDGLVLREQEGLDKIYARIKQEKDGFRADATSKIEQQQTRIKQAQERRDAEIKAAEKKFEGSIGGTKAYEDAVKKAKDNELSVASRAQAEILKINEQLDKDLKTIDSKYAKDIADYNKRINELRNQANSKTVDIDKRIAELEAFIATEQKSIDGVREEKFGYEKQYRKLEAEVGPIKYIAEFIYGEQADQNLLEAAVRWVIIIIIFVFDPLAVLLLIASQYTFNWYREDKGGGLPPKQNPDPEPEIGKDEEKKDELVYSQEADQTGTSDGEPQSTEKVEPTLSKKKDSQYLLWSDIDPDPQESAEQEDFLPQKNIDPNQLEFDFDFYQRQEDETEEEYNKRIWKSENPGMTINFVKKLKEQGSVDTLPWEKDNTKDDLEAWNEWVEKANEEAEKNPELPKNKTQFTEVIEPKGFTQNEEQREDSNWNKINKARQSINLDKIKELEITEEQYRNASQLHIIKLIERLKAGLITVDDLSSTEASKINDMLKMRG
jgi:uncharacterized coiled-coil protein SlyX